MNRNSTHRTLFSIPCLLAMLLLGLLYPRAGKAQTSKLVRGVVVATDNNERLPGVNVVLENAQQGTTTNKDGEFAITVPNANAVLVFSFVGYLPQKIKAGSQSLLDIRLEPDNKQLDEVVVVGYGEVKKSDLTGSVGQIKTKTVGESGYGNLQQAMAGKVAGVVVNENSGAPGAGLSIEIRGTGSISFSTQPLYVVDGIPLESPNVAGLQSNANTLGASGSSPLAAINPNDVASIEILKDASATAIYGSRGANGVVLITTKSGQVGKPKFTLNASNGFSSMPKYLNMLNGQDYTTLANEAYKYQNPTSSLVPYSGEEIQSVPSYDHQRAITSMGQTRDINLTVSGGDSRNKYYLSGQYFDQSGIIRSTRLTRYNLKLNLDNELSPKLRLTTNLNITNTAASGNVLNSFNGGLLQSALLWAPTVPLLNPDGSYNVVRNYFYGNTLLNDPTFGPIYYNSRFPSSTVVANVSTALNNPLAYLNGGGVQNDNTSLQILGNMTATYKLGTYLKMAGVLGVTMYNSLLENYIPTTVPSTATLRGVASLGNLQSTKLLYQTTLTYDRKFANHSLNAVVGATAEKYVEKIQNSSSQSFVNDITGINNIQAGQVPQVPTSNYSGYQLVSSIFRASYNYDQRYYLTLSGRLDGSSKFAPENQFGFFPSLGASWRIVNEKLFKNNSRLNFVSELKLRGSYGIIGNQALGPYNTLSTLSSANAVFGGAINAGYAPSRLPNPQLRWEETRQANVGIDIGLFSNRVSITADLYQKQTENLLFNVDLPATSGFTALTKNVARIKNEGLELALTTVNVRTNNFQWTTSFNIAFNRNTLLSLAGKEGEFLGINNLIGGAYLSRLEPGQSVGSFYGYKTLPTWNDSTIRLKPAAFQPGAVEGDRRYTDINGDGLLTDADRVNLGSAMPRYTGGFTTNLTYKNFDLTAFFSYSYGNKVFNQLDWTYTNLGGLGNAYQKTFDDRYIPIRSLSDPTQAASQKARNYETRAPAAGSRFDPREITDYYIEDASFLRCKDINLSYRLPAQVAQRLKASNMMVYLNLQNLFTLTNYTGFNPELNTNSLNTRGLDNGSYPLARTVRAGLNVTF